jgi:hypothetical protein
MKMMYTLVALCTVMLLTASDQASQVRQQLLECFDRVPVTVPSFKIERTWFADYRLFDVQELSKHDRKNMAKLIGPTASKLLRCYVGLVEGIDPDIVQKIKQTILTKFNEDDDQWLRPSDGAPAFNLAECLYRMNVDDHRAEGMAVDFVWFHCCDNEEIAKRYTQWTGTRPLHELIVPQSIMLHMIILAKNSDDQEYLKSCNMREKITPQALEVLTQHAQMQPMHHQSSCMRFDTERFAALVKQLFVHNNV